MRKILGGIVASPDGEPDRWNAYPVKDRSGCWVIEGEDSGGTGTDYIDHVVACEETP